LAYIDFPDGWDFSVEAARAGMVKSYVFEGNPTQRAPEIAAAEAEALSR
jgi:micrococcal nuclease